MKYVYCIFTLLFKYFLFYDESREFMKNHKEQLKTNSNTLGQQNREGGYAPTLEINA